MGSTSDEEGESSTQTSNPDERPLKKARYIWQIKGKYHLKKPDEEEKDGQKLSSCESNVNSDDYTALGIVDLNCVEDLKDELTKKTIPLVPNFILDSVENKEELESPSPCSSYEMYRLSDTISNLELTKWQDRQVARCFVDNTINRVLEVMGFIPLPFETDDISDDEYGGRPNQDDNSLEDEAVLMAIHSHGLQRSERESQESGTTCCSEEVGLPVPCMCRQHTSSVHSTQKLNPFHKRPVVCIPKELDQLKEIDRPRRSYDIYSEPTRGTSSIESYIQIPKLSDSLDNNPHIFNNDSLRRITPSDELKLNVSEDSISTSHDTVEEIPSPMFDHNDFLNQAVSAAIMKKGLGTFGCTDLG